MTGWIFGWKRNGWKTADKKPVKNVLDLWQRLDEAQARHKVEWRWIKGHAGHAENERADELAREDMAPFKKRAQPHDGGGMTLLVALDFASVAVFALTGALVASRAQLDLVGFIFIACLTALGGGTLRDMLINRDPVFWIGQPGYLAVASLAALVVFVAAPRLEEPLPGAVAGCLRAGGGGACRGGRGTGRGAGLAGGAGDGDDHRLHGGPDARCGLQ